MKKRICLLSILFLLCFFCGCGAADKGAADKVVAEKKEKTEPSEKVSVLKITMINVNQGLSLLLEHNGEYMLYDGGRPEGVEHLLDYLQKRGVTHLKYLVASHYHDDHIAGLIDVLDMVSVDTVIWADYQADRELYETFMDKVNALDCQEIHPEVGDQFQLGDTLITVLAPESYDQEEENDNSIVMRAKHGSFSCLITGDAGKLIEDQLVDSDAEIDSTVYVVGHHGNTSSSNEEFLAAVKPEAVLLSVGPDYSYRHPKEETMERLRATGAKLFRTDKQGDVSIATDGKNWLSDVEACEDWSTGEE